MQKSNMLIFLNLNFPQNDLWERGKNRLSVTSRKIREAFSPPGSPVGGADGGESGSGVYDDVQVISDEEEEEEDGDGIDDKHEENGREEDLSLIHI